MLIQSPLDKILAYTIVLVASCVILNARAQLTTTTRKSTTTTRNITTTTTTTTTTKTTTEEPILSSVIVNRHDFKYLLNPEYEICRLKVKKERLFLIIYVHTAPGNFKRRLSLRETWARRSMFRDVRVVFTMGTTTDNKVNKLLKLEYATYNDIVQEDFVDSYRNLTYKGIMALKWISQYCPDAKYVLKVDDDIIANIFILLRHLKSLDDHNIIKSKTVMCLVWVGMAVMREKNSKWYLSKDEFKQDVYDKYCSGSAYILTGDLPKLMYDTSWYVKFFWVDDYYMTGLLIRGVNASYEFFNSLYIINSNLIDQRFTGKQSDFTVFGHLPDQLNKIYNLWDYILRNQMSRFPSLLKINAQVIFENDFKHLKDFRWTSEIWNEFLKPIVDDGSNDKPLSLFYQRTF
jgi:hypothetical protein